MSPYSSLRHDQQLIVDLVPQGARVLDLGCGDGTLLEAIRDSRGAFVRGVELDPEKVAACIGRGLSVFQGDLDQGLVDFPDDSFDVVVLSQTLQVVHRPALVVGEMLRVGERAVVSFPNFAYWRHRARLALSGRMPLSKALPYQWYDTPNIHFTTLKDFGGFAEKLGAHVEKRFPLAEDGPGGFLVRSAPNLFAAGAVFILAGGRESPPQPLACCDFAKGAGSAPARPRG